MLYEQATQSTDKTIKIYPNMLHSPLCEFPDVRSKVEQEIVSCIDDRL